MFSAFFCRPGLKKTVRFSQSFIESLSKPTKGGIRRSGNKEINWEGKKDQLEMKWLLEIAEKKNLLATKKVDLATRYLNHFQFCSIVHCR
jgi:hypothetical protein